MTNPREPLAEVETDSVSRDSVSDDEVRAALAVEEPLTVQRGLEVCETLAEDDPTAVEPFLDVVATLAGEGNSALALRAIAVFDAVAAADPTVLDGRLGALAARAGAAVVDVQLTSATALSKVVLAEPALVTPFLGRLVGGIRETEPDEAFEPIDEFVDDERTRRAIQNHQDGERKRRISARRTLSNVVVAAIEPDPSAGVDHIEELASLLADSDPGVVGPAVDALGEVAAVEPAAVVPAEEPLIECLEHSQVVVRARAVRALGRLGSEAAVPKLESIAATEEKDELREVAEETVAYLRG